MTDQNPSGPDRDSSPEASFGFNARSERDPSFNQPDSPTPDADSTPDVSASDPQNPALGDDAAHRRGRRRRRGRRGRGRPDGRAGEPADAPPSEGAVDGPVEPPLFEADEPDGLGVPPPALPDTTLDAPPVAGEEPRRRRRRRRRGRRGDEADPSGSPFDARPEPDLAAFDSPAAADEPPVRDPNAPSLDDEFAPPQGDASAPPQSGEPRRRRRRGRRRRGGEPAPFANVGDEARPSEPNAEAETDVEADAPADAAPTGAASSQSEDQERRRRRRGRRGGRRRKRKGEPALGPVEVEIIPGDDDEFFQPGASASPEELPELPDDAQLVSPPRAGPRRGRQPRVDEETDEDLESELRPIHASRKRNVILVNASDSEEVRVAVVEGSQLVDFQMTAKHHKSFVNDIYRGKVVNLEPAIGAAFVDFGEGRNGFLHTSDVLSVYGDPDWSLEKLLTTKVDPDEWESGDKDSHDHDDEHVDSHDHDDSESSGDEDGDAPAAVHSRRPAPRESHRRGGHKRMRARPRLPISDLLKKGDSVVVQITKDAIGDKGPTLTTYISIPGRYLVLMPSMARTGVSRKIEDEKERRRLKKILQQLEIPPGMGVIVRTAGIGCTKADIKRDLDYLMLLWESFGKRLMLGRGPAPLYEESDVAIRTIRDLFTPATEAVVVDDAHVFERVREFTEKLMPENVERIKLHEGTKPLFHAYNVEQEFERLFARRIDLPSGGSIVFDQAEALVAIDVNSGKTRTDGFDFEDIALKTNLDAVPEIARQIRLRDLGGIIVIDFIDMQRMSSRRNVERAFRNAISEDRARSKLGRISQFGLLELTRQRLGPGLVKMIFTNCPRCRGSGRVRTPESRAQAILRRLGAALALKGFTKVEVRTQPDVVENLKRNSADRIQELEKQHEREIALSAVPDQIEDSVLRYLRADGREVRPGGRRKR